MDAVAAGINPPPAPNTLGTLSSILGLQQQRIALQQQAAQLESQQSAATVAQQGAKETQAAAQLLQDPVGNGLIDADGNPTKDAQSIIMKTMPTTGAVRYENIVNAAKTKVEYNTAVNSLNAQKRTEFGAASGGILSGARSGTNFLPDVQQGYDALVSQREGSPEYDSFKKMADTQMQMIRHAQQKQDASGQVIPAGQEAGRTVGLQAARSVLGAAGTVGPGGIGAPGQGQINTGSTQYQGVVAPALQGGGFTPTTAVNNQLPPTVVGLASNQPAVIGGAARGGNGFFSPQSAAAAVAPQTGANRGGGAGGSGGGRGIGPSGLDMSRAKQVSDAQQASGGVLPLTTEVDRLAKEINASAIAGTVTQGLKDLGFTNQAEARTQLNKDLGLIKGPIATQAGSDSKLGTILEGYPTDKTPEGTIHAAMDYIRGTLKQNLARGQLLQSHGYEGFQAADDALTRTTNPLMYEAASLPKGQPNGFYKRNFGTPEAGTAFKQQVDALKKHTRFFDGNSGE